MVHARIKQAWSWALAEISAVIAMGIAAGGLLSFAAIADEMHEGDAHFFDRSVLLALRNPANVSDPLGPAWVEHAVGDITALGGYAVLTLLIAGVVGYLLTRGKSGIAALVLAATLSGTALSETLKAFFGRARPDLAPHLVDTYSASFPSGHAMLSAVVYLTLGVLLARAQERRRLKIFVLSAAVLLTLMIGASRIYLGVHWPTDVLAGWCLGAAWAALWQLIAWRLEPRPV